MFVLFRDIPLKMHVPLPEENFFKVPRDSFPLLNEMQVYVVATNAFGQATSNLLVVDPIKTGQNWTCTLRKGKQNQDQNGFCLALTVLRL